MILEILDVVDDKVINSKYVTVKFDYEFAIKNVFPLIDKLEIQRNPLKPGFYERLKNDIIDGCVMPPITISFVDRLHNGDVLPSESIKEEITKNISKAFVLDGIQRLNTLHAAAIETEDFDYTRPMYANIILSDSTNKLLYRMIILNNGQKPMSARHQIEILVGRFTDNLNLERKYMNRIYSEKDALRNDGKTKIKKDVLVKSYMAYTSSSISIDNQKIIESKLDEIIARKIVSSNIKQSDVELSDLTKFIIDMALEQEEMGNTPNLFDWFNNENNLIGLFVGMSESRDFLNNDLDAVLNVYNFSEQILASVKPSKIKVSSSRRKVIKEVVVKYNKFVNNPDYLDEYITEFE